MCERGKFCLEDGTNRPGKKAGHDHPVGTLPSLVFVVDTIATLPLKVLGVSLAPWVGLIRDQLLDDTVQAGLMAMTPEFRQAVLLADVEGLAYEEVADIMRTSVGTVRSRLSRARARLRHLTQTEPPNQAAPTPALLRAPLDVVPIAVAATQTVADQHTAQETR